MNGLIWKMMIDITSEHGTGTISRITQTKVMESIVNMNYILVRNIKSDSQMFLDYHFLLFRCKII